MGQTKICRYCGNVIDVDAENCEYCRKYLYKEHDNKDLFCAKCKAPVNTDDNFCQKCGAVFNIPDENEFNQPVEHNVNGIPYNIGILLTSFAISIAATVFAAVGKETTVGGNCVFFGIAFIIAEIFLYIYFLPSIIAIENNRPNTLLIYICNLLLGVTVIGWFFALILSLQSNQKNNF